MPNRRLTTTFASSIQSPHHGHLARYPFKLPTLEEILSAEAIVRQTMNATPQYRWPLLEEVTGSEVWVKHENHAPTGSFKVRGGLYYMERLTSAHSTKAVITASRGNHGQSVALAARDRGISATVVVPHGNATEKNHAIRALGADLLECGDDFQAATEAASIIAADQGMHQVPSFHPWLVAGVATYALELLKAVPHLDVMYVPIGLGSGLCGAVAARNALGHKAEIVGVVAAGAPAYALSLNARKLIAHDVTTRLADGMACRVPHPDAFNVMRVAAVRLVQVGDDQIADAMRLLFRTTHNATEGAGAAATAALLSEARREKRTSRAVVLSGHNVDTRVFENVLRSRAVD